MKNRNTVLDIQAQLELQRERRIRQALTGLIAGGVLLVLFIVGVC